MVNILWTLALTLAACGLGYGTRALLLSSGEMGDGGFGTAMMAMAVFIVGAIVLIALYWRVINWGIN